MCTTRDGGPGHTQAAGEPEEVASRIGTLCNVRTHASEKEPGDGELPARQLGKRLPFQTRRLRQTRVIDSHT